MLEKFHYMIIFGHSNDIDLNKLMTKFSKKSCNLVNFLFRERENEFLSFIITNICVVCTHAMQLTIRLLKNWKIKFFVVLYVTPFRVVAFQPCYLLWPQGLTLDMTKRAGWVRSIELQVKQVAGQKRVILSGLKTSSGQSGCGSSRVNPYFSHDFFYIKKTTCIFHLESHATNYMM